jgi:hypothetical protein
VFDFSQKLTIELTADQSDLLKHGFGLLRRTAEEQMLFKLSFAERMRVSSQYAFTGGWVRKLDAKAQTITLKGKSEYRYFIEMVYLLALTMKSIALEKGVPVRYELNILKGVMAQIATGGGVPLPPFEALDVGG